MAAPSYSGFNASSVHPFTSLTGISYTASDFTSISATGGILTTNWASGSSVERTISIPISTTNCTNKYVQVSNGAPTFNRRYTLKIRFRDTGGNTKTFTIFTDNRAVDTTAIFDLSTAANGTTIVASGTLDLTSINQVDLLITKVAADGAGAFSIEVIYLIDDLLATDGEIANPITLNGIYDYAISGGTLASSTNLMRQAESTIASAHRIRIGNGGSGYFNNNNIGGLFFRSNFNTSFNFSGVFGNQVAQEILSITNSFRSITWNFSNSFEILNLQFSGCTFTDNSSGTLTFRAFVFDSMLAINYGIAIVSANQISNSVGSVSGGSQLLNCTISGTASGSAYVWTTATITGTTFSNNNRGIEVGTPGTYEFDQNTFTDNTTDIYINDSNTANHYIFQVDALTTFDGGSTPVVVSTGATYEVVSPQPILQLSGIVSGSRVYVRDTTNNTTLHNATVSGTTLDLTVTAGVALLIRVRNASSSPKYKTYETTVPVMPGSDLPIVVNQILDE